MIKTNGYNIIYIKNIGIEKSLKALFGIRENTVLGKNSANNKTIIEENKVTNNPTKKYRLLTSGKCNT
tara:strand:- start:39 stop:242 length:204 start_codon:yes stop_codon:yes gene_type:complete